MKLVPAALVPDATGGPTGTHEDAEGHGHEAHDHAAGASSGRTTWWTSTG